MTQPFQNEYPSGETDLRHKRVLIADDDPDILDILKTLISQYMQVRTTKSSLEALSIALNWQPDVFVIDWMMPKLPGNQLTQMLRSKPEFKDTPIIFISAKSTETARKMVAKFGVQDFITKPFEPQEVLQAVLKYLQE